MFARLLGIPVISVEAVAAQRERLFIVDASAPMGWQQAHVPGAVHLDPGDYHESDLPTDKETQIVFYCSGPLCPMAPGAAKRAQRMGFNNVSVMTEGIAGWIEKGHPTETCASSAT